MERRESRSCGYPFHKRGGMENCRGMVFRRVIDRVHDTQRTWISHFTTIKARVTSSDIDNIILHSMRPSIYSDVSPLNAATEDSLYLSSVSLILLDFIDRRMSIQCSHMIIWKRRRNSLHKFMFMLNLSYSLASFLHPKMLTSFISDTLLDSTNQSRQTRGPYALTSSSEASCLNRIYR